MNTPAEKLADIATALAAHLRTHTHLDVTGLGIGLDAHMLLASGHSPTSKAKVISDWAASFTEPTIRARRYQTDRNVVAVFLTADVHGIEVDVWVALTILDFPFEMAPGVEQELTLVELHDVLGTTPAEMTA